MYIAVYDALGATVYSSFTNFKDATADVSIGDVAAGSYYMLLRESSGATYKFRFVKK